MLATADALEAFFAENPEAIIVNVKSTKGSTPRNEDAWMVVARDSFLGTIGGGELEWQALAQARDLLSNNAVGTGASINLGPQTGQCCGGQVELEFALASLKARKKLLAKLRQQAESCHSVYVFGAGHVGMALAKALSPLPMIIHLVDTRPEMLENIPHNVIAHAVAVPESVVEQAPAASSFVIVTHDHGLDFLIASAALQIEETAYVGMIGSKTKRARFRKLFLEQGGKPDQFARLICPVGKSKTENKAPEVIAAMITAELVETLL